MAPHFRHTYSPPVATTFPERGTFAYADERLNLQNGHFAAGPRAMVRERRATHLTVPARVCVPQASPDATFPRYELLPSPISHGWMTAHMTPHDGLSDGEAKAIARIVFNSSQGVLYLTKKEFENVAIEADPNAAPPISVEGREEYVNLVLLALPWESSAKFLADVVRTFQGRVRNAVAAGQITDADAEPLRGRITATASRISKVLEWRHVGISEDGSIGELSPYVHLQAMRDYVYDGLGRWGLADVRRLLENAETHFSGGSSNPLQYDDCASNSARALEGTLRKALVQVHLKRGHPDPSDKLKAMMGQAIKELDALGFWPDRAVREAADNYREFLRNRAQHYDTVDMNIKLKGFDRATAFFALWETITLVGTIVHLMDAL